MSLSQLLFFRKKGEPMTFEDAYFKKKVLKPDSLEPFGFTATEQGYEFRKMESSFHRWLILATKINCFHLHKPTV